CTRPWDGYYDAMDYW
nr:immunoglobulin heavy chain junction region [Mus musculus]